MAEDFPDDSYFRNSNVALLDAAVNTKECDNHVFNDSLGQDANVFNGQRKVASAGCKVLPTSKFTTATSNQLITSNTKSTISSDNRGFNETSKSEHLPPIESFFVDHSKNERVTDSKLVKDLAHTFQDPNQKGKHGSSNKNVCGEPPAFKPGKAKQETKDQKKNEYRPLNITRSICQNSAKHSSSHDSIPDIENDTLPEPKVPESHESKSHSVRKQGSTLIADSSSLEECSDISVLPTEHKLKLDAWGLPPKILKQYAKRGITSMFPWQVECLCCPRVLAGGNLVYSAPTSAGKTLVSEILCIKAILEKRKKVLFILPFVSVVREKMFYFQELLGGSGIRVDGYMGGHGPAGGFCALDLAVCTIEKANSLINKLMEEGTLSILGAVVVDELHLLGDSHRGYLLELLLTKLKYMSTKNTDVSIQLVGMSATLPNLSLLSTWLGADLYKTTFRPIPLEEYIKVGSSVYTNDMKILRTISPKFQIKGDVDNIVYLCMETIADGHSVLIFCPTKNRCESLAQKIATEFRTIGQNRDPNAPDSLPFKLREQLNPNAISQALEQLRRCPVGLDHILAKTVSFGVAFHHAGLTMDERDIVEGSFRNSTLRVVVATSTLSSGVNLPARRVIVRSPVFHGRPIDILTYRQMIGRAGRMGVDTAGESFLVCQASEQRIAESLVHSQLKPIKSCLGLGSLSASLKRAILEVIASGVATTPADVELYTNCTLLAASCKESGSQSFLGSESFHKSKETVTSNPVLSCVNFLRDSEFIRLQEGEDGVTHYVSTPLGQACLSASLPPDEGLMLFSELQRARQCFVLENELHIIYQVTPFNVSEQWGNLDWLQVLALWEQLPSDMKRVGELVGVEDRFIVRAMRGTINFNSEKQRQKLMVHRRFYTALALNDLVNEVPLSTVANKFNCTRGMLQSLQQSASTYAGMVTSFCRRLGWSSVELLVEQFQDRLQFGTQRELLDLLRLSSLNGPRARALHNSGITTLAELTTADVLVVENALHSSVPFVSEKERDGESVHETEQRKKLKGVWVTGRQGLTEREAAELIISEARSLIMKELGLKNVYWEDAQVYEQNELPLLNNLAADEMVTSINGMQSSSNGSQKSGNNIQPPYLPSDKKPSEISSVLHNEQSSDRNEAMLKTDDSDDHKPKKATPPKQNADQKIVKLKSNNDVKGKLSQVPKIESTIFQSQGKVELFPEALLESTVSKKTDQKHPMLNHNHPNLTASEFHKKSRSFSKNSEDSDNSDSRVNSTLKRTNKLDSKNKLYTSSRKPSRKNRSIDCFASTSPDHQVNASVRTSPLLRQESVNESKSRRNSLEMFFDSLPFSNSVFNKLDENIMISEKNVDESKCKRNVESNMKNSLAVYFDSFSFSSSALGKLSSPHANEIEPTYQGTKENETFCETSKVNRSPKSHMKRKYSLDHLCMSTLSESAFNQSGGPKVEKEENNKKNVRRLSSDLFIMNTQEQESKSSFPADGKSSATSGLGSTYFTPPSGALKRSDKEINCSSTQKLSETVATTLMLDESPKNSTCINSPSLFGDSFELNSNLCNALDVQLKENILDTRLGYESVSTEDIVQESTLNTPSHVGNCSKVQVVNESSSCNHKTDTPTFCEVLNICSVMSSVSGGTRSKTHLALHSAKIIPDQSLSEDMFESPMNEMLERNEQKTSCAETPTSSLCMSRLPRKNSQYSPTSKNVNTDVLTDSFMEAAFQSAFDCETSTIPKRTLSYNTEQEANHVGKNFIHSSKSVFVKGEEGRHVSNTVSPSSVRKRRMVSTFPDEEPASGISSESPFKRQKLKYDDICDTKNDILKSFQEKAFQSETKRQTLKHTATADKFTRRMTPKNVYNKTAEMTKEFEDDTSSPLTCIGPPQSKRVLRQRQELSKKLQQELDSLPSVASSHCSRKLREHCEDSKTGNSSSVKQDWSMFSIVDVCGNISLFKAFSEAIKTAKAFSLSLACQRELENSEQKMSIGTNVVKRSNLRTKSSHFDPGPSPLAYDECRLIGVAFCFGGVDAYYIKLQIDDKESCVPLNDRLYLLQELFGKNSEHPSREVFCFDIKEQYKVMYRCLGIPMNIGLICDPKVADWLLEPEGKEKNLQAMVVKYLENASSLAEHAGNVRGGVGSPALDLDQTIPGCKRSCVEAILCWHLSAVQKTMLFEAQLLKFFREVEMPVVLTLARMELNGIGFSSETAELLRVKLMNEMSTLEERAYQLAGRAFSLTSPADTARVVYQELRLGVGNSPRTGRGVASRNKVSSRRGGTKSTSKEALSKLSSEHPLPGIILLWRKMNAIITKVVFPLLQPQQCTRMFARCISHTATGRITMHEPNLQSIPRDFDISPDAPQNFSMRHAFVPCLGNILIAADYSQLELRLLAHLSDDNILRSILNSGLDVFCSIAASWNKIPLEQVSDVLRQRAKQICYGMIYGMGSSALAEQLGVKESEAAIFLESFRDAYPCVRQFLNNTVERCRNEGYVETLLGRRRYLPNITSANANIRAHAERQAVNTTVQGSAADLAKCAMVAVDKALRAAFPNEPLVLQHSKNRNSRGSSTESSARGTGPHLVLHLHDELMYEVSAGEVERVAQILHSAMENAIQLSVKLPVKVRAGESWGTLKEL